MVLFTEREFNRRFEKVAVNFNAETAALRNGKVAGC